MSANYINGDAREDDLDALWDEAASWSQDHVDELADDLAEAVETRNVRALFKAIERMNRTMTAFKDLADEIRDTEGDSYDDEEE